MRIVFVFLVTCSSAIHANDTSLIALRNYFFTSAHNSAAAKQFFNATHLINKSEAVKFSYRGVAYMMQSKYAFNPYTKWSNFSKGRDMLEIALKQSPGNIEIHFLRFSIQSNIPFFLNYTNDIGNDKKIILEGWNEIEDKDLKSKIKQYIITSDAFTDSEKNLLQ